MTPRQQWRTLRAPLVKRAWDMRSWINQPEPGSHLKYYFGGTPKWRRAEAVMQKRVFPIDQISERGFFAFVDALNTLDAMRAAERNGESALVWKLSR